MKKIALIVLTLIILLFGFFGLKSLEFFKKISISSRIKTTPVPEKTQYTIALLGYGGGNHEGAYLTDSIMLVTLDKKVKKIILTSIPRDLWVKLPTQGQETYSTKINSVYQINLFPDNLPAIAKKYRQKIPGLLIKEVLKNITGLQVDYFVAVDFQSFIKFIDTLGGVDINVERSFTDVEYPLEGKEKDLCGKEEQFAQIEPFLKPGYNPTDKENLLKDKPELNEFLRTATEEAYLAFPCRYEKLEFVKGKTHMDGSTALKFARSRHSLDDGGDFRRGARQQQLIQAIKNKVLSPLFITKIIPLYQKLENDLTTDVELSLINRFLPEIKNADQYQIKQLILSNENFLTMGVSEDGQSIVMPKKNLYDYSEIKSAISKLLKGLSLTPTISQNLKLKNQK